MWKFNMIADVADYRYRSLVFRTGKIDILFALIRKTRRTCISHIRFPSTAKQLRTSVTDFFLKMLIVCSNVAAVLP